MHTLGNMDQEVIESAEDELQVGVLIADSAMFQRMKPDPEAPDAGKYDGTDPEGFQAEGDTELLDFSPLRSVTAAAETWNPGSSASAG